MKRQLSPSAQWPWRKYLHGRVLYLVPSYFGTPPAPLGREDMSGGGRPVAEGPSGGMAATKSVSFGSSRLPIGVILLAGERSRGCIPPGAEADAGDAAEGAEVEDEEARKGLPMLRSTPRSIIS